ncbi:hypothetical protein CCY99_04835 [Helicobacter sp. 16-1353]|uniref:hypothetical protein n=1 Tax=Helicobacter sp. 16-1353 TaxID=2004996 RepID=UPI000DCBCDFC|nr:hypothetical protein [Helicobacter sp. 16-1353]RAX54012.1 hypothetical protein CCY99_04835 [Helicobacter sp. 16-1353]
MSNYKLESNKILIDLDADIYSTEDVILAHHRISNECILLLSTSNKMSNATLHIVLECHDKIDNIAKDFFYFLSQQQTKRILSKQNQKIRDLIVEQAFKPIADLQRVVDEL